MKNHFFGEESKETRQSIFRVGKRGGASYPALTVVNLAHRNSFNPQHSGGSQDHYYYSRFCSRFARRPQKHTELAEETCDFCGGYRGEELNRRNFLFAPAALNYPWFEKSNLRILLLLFCAQYAFLVRDHTFCRKALLCVFIKPVYNCLQ